MLDRLIKVLTSKKIVILVTIMCVQNITILLMLTQKGHGWYFVAWAALGVTFWMVYFKK